MADRSRTTADGNDDVVVFLIGMRVNRWRHLHRWLPVAAAMPRMLRELDGAGLGLLDARSYVSGRVVLVVQYWSSFEALEAYARAGDREHLPAWRSFNLRARSSDSVGIFHETHVVPASARESIYVHMPPHGLAKAMGSAPLTQRGLAAAHRLDPARPDRPLDPGTTPSAGVPGRPTAAPVLPGSGAAARRVGGL
jgi:hypothetical protein